MDLKQELATALSTFASGNMPREEPVERLLKDAASRHQLLMHPRLTAALARRAASRSALTCTEVEDLLPVLVDAERKGEQIRPGYRQMSLHLRLCPECYEVYRAATDILAAQATGTLPLWPQASKRPARAPATIILSRERIQSTLGKWQHQRAFRGRGGTQSHQILYTGNVPEQPDLFAKVSLAPPLASAAGFWEITVTLSGAAVLAHRRISLSFGNETCTASTDVKGVAQFLHIPATWITPPDAPELQISVDASSTT
jgi:hypothetical protein